jgi:hypothetical protein
VLRLLELVPLQERTWIFDSGEFQSACDAYRSRMKRYSG